MTLDGKWFTNDGIAGTKIRLANNENLRGRNNANSADINLLKVNASDIPEFVVQPQFNGTPSTDNDLVNRGYVTGALAGARDPKDACRVASTADVVIASALEAGDSIDGVVLVAGDRVLLKDQTLPAQNGIYVAVAAAAGAASRSTDADADAEVTQGMSTIIAEGTINARRQYALTSADPLTVDTTALVFAQVPNPANLLVPKTYLRTLDGTDVGNGYIDLPHDAVAQSVQVSPVGGPDSTWGTDFIVSTVSNVSRLTFGGDLTALAAIGDALQVNYVYEA